ncbi:diguanylate cyclase (GGDEF)-like protein [Acholeplasma morum]|uniref:GGDEF domain-containing phosphodiesterase n=1 Tax=Paracholeplasma morum TaxID=264637 RepID=UPI0019585193|nr:GGDEF domain-containing phosphodiesterase [Paracholeplasma morum]MBM7453326.1 diguanylate cyclase (GGDEF)-like protein [Paracholeplasma morum]
MNDINSTTAVIIFLFILFATGVVAYFLFISVRETERRWKEERSIMVEGVISKSAMNSLLASYISKIGKDAMFSIIYADLDRFSEITQAFGDKESKKIMDKLTKRIRSVLPKDCKASLYEKDIYIIFIPIDYDQSDTHEIARRIQEQINESITLFGSTEINLTASISIAYFPMHGETTKQLINSLKLANYTVKKTGGNAIRLYNEDMSQTEGEFLDYYYQIKNAISKKEFLLYYHPIVDTKKEQVYGVEALLRWNHPEHGLLSPFKFINIMEQSGDIYWVGLWGLESLIKSYYEFKQVYPKADIKFTFNISPKQLLNESLAVDFQRILKKYKMNAETIILEIAEFALFDKHEVVMQNISQLRLLGFQFAVDGFGLDYATLAKLETMPLDTIKLSKEFLNEEHSYVKSRFVNLLVEFANKNNKTIISEGIENREMLNAINDYGIDIVQGFYFARPMSFDSFKIYFKETDISNFLKK